MAAPQVPSMGAMSEAPIIVKISINDALRKFKLHLSDVAPAVFADKIRTLLQIPAGKELTLERYSDSSASYITLSTANPSSYKQLYRAAKAKSKLRLKATVSDATPLPKELTPAAPEAKPELKESSAVDPAANLTKNLGLIHRAQPTAVPASSYGSAWHVCCNNCDKAVLDAHYHCSTCEAGDYDLCEACVSSGILCPGAGHWLIKRNIQNGKIITGTTERLTPKIKSVSGGTNLTKQTTELPEKTSVLTQKQASLLPIPGSFANEPKAPAVIPAEPKRTCNACVRVLPETRLVTCRDCGDYDLCFDCTQEDQHGHHPAHTFAAITENASLPSRVSDLCAPGRAEYHWATCDGCDGRIQGVRHKCLDCPDWDFCSKCHENSQSSHPGHRFVPVYEKMNWSLPKKTRHFGIYCDGPLCKDSKHQSYIQGVRYKCAICHDTDFCANCEAHPKNAHNKTHPMLMFKTQVKNASISTIGEDSLGMPMAPMGDRRVATRAVAPVAAATVPASGLQTMTQPHARSLFAGLPPAYDATCASKPTVSAATRQAAVSVPGSQLDAHFVRDTVSDGSKFQGNTTFVQQWTLRNPGPHAWPAGVTVRTTGGDNMLDIDPARPAGFVELSSAQESQPTLSPVQPGSEWQFTVTLRSPQRAGKHISYWRAKAPDGTPFGHKLWCEIEVRPAKSDETQANVRRTLPGANCSLAMMQQMLQYQQQVAAYNKTAAKPQQIPVTSVASSSNEGPVTVRQASSHASRASSMRDANRKIREMQQAQLAQFDEQLKKLEAQAQALAITKESITSKSDASTTIANPTTTATEQKAQAMPADSQPTLKEKADSSDSTTSSQMVFPTLDKESPSSSTQLEAKEPAHEIIASAPASVRLEAAPETVKTESVQESVGDEFTNDFDSVEFEENTDEDDEDGFLTDEEYDILDASDEEIMNNGK